MQFASVCYAWHFALMQDKEGVERVGALHYLHTFHEPPSDAQDPRARRLDDPVNDAVLQGL